MGSDSEPTKGTTIEPSLGPGRTKVTDNGVELRVVWNQISWTSTIVGKHVRLEARHRDADHKRASGRWKIPGAIRGYRHNWENQEESKILPLRTDDLAMNPIELYWTSPGSYKVEFIGDDGSTTAETFTVTAPEVCNAYAILTKVIFAYADTSLGRKYWVGAGNYNKTKGEWPGIKFVYSVKAGDYQEGHICGVQLMTRGGVITTLDGQAKPLVHRPKRPGELYLDQKAPYGSDVGEVQLVGDDEFYWREPGVDRYGDPGDCRDTPTYPLESYEHIKVADRFQMHLMYRPTDHDSIWVTLRRIDWEWEAEAGKNDANPPEWELIGEPQLVAHTRLPPLDPPEWSHIAGRLSSGDSSDHQAGDSSDMWDPPV